MRESTLIKLLNGADLRSLGNAGLVAGMIKCQQDFDSLFRLLYHSSRYVVMRAADALEKISRHQPEYLHRHTDEIFRLSRECKHKELKWHLAQLIPRVTSSLTVGRAWKTLLQWAIDKSASRICRVNSIQGMYEISLRYPDFKTEFRDLLPSLEAENIPSLNARIGLLKNKFDREYQ